MGEKKRERGRGIERDEAKRRVFQRAGSK